jgi:hypothetical protein
MMNEQQIDTARAIVVNALDSLSDAEIGEIISTPFLDMVPVKQAAFAA